MLPKDNFKRQVEILGLCLNGTYAIGDLEDLYDCGKATIERDLEALRSLGIRIHSSGKKGVRVLSEISPAMLRQLVTEYLVLSNSADLYDKATALLVQSLKSNAVSILAHIQRAIDCSNLVVIDYQKDIEKVEFDREIAPTMVFQKEQTWRVLAIHDRKFKQYIIGKILKITPTNKKFNKPSKRHIEQLFQFSFKSWIGKEAHQFKVQLNAVWGKALKLKPIMEYQAITEQPDGTYLLEGVVSSLDEIAGWIASKGIGVKVLSPKELKDKVLKIGQGILANYSE